MEWKEEEGMGSEHTSANVNTWNFSLIFRRWLSTFAKKKMQNYFVWAHALSLSSAHSLTIYSFSSISFDALNENYGIRCVQDWWHGCFAAVRLLTFLCCWCFFSLCSVVARHLSTGILFSLFFRFLWTYVESILRFIRCAAAVAFANVLTFSCWWQQC